MNYSTKQLEQIHEYATNLTPVGDIAYLMGIDPDELRADIGRKNAPVSLACHRGKAETSLCLRKQEIDFAKLGSPLAVRLASSYIQDMTDDEDL